MTKQEWLFFIAFTDETRLRILNLLSYGEACINLICETLKQPQPKISRHISVLKEAKLVRGRRDGKWIHYRLVKPENPYFAEILKNILSWLSQQDELKHDIKEFFKIITSPEKKLPKSNIFVKTDTRIKECKKELEIFLL
ncbi:MAG: metalloregulator ArsR/SmtB family transcription factor [Pyrinomonadaceae bacterium]|nr:metalloregulator ArsR/SmtB family transcription factor [Pyrinomonadaceae bacterium]MCX7639954.1 metalloregulator ArsR/SmtB family transcription factor [Pyrinomonadaceae bacterium]MDW8304126.1 metalloregulator ArsR/SmtB family transcription factor [Acidobacteriota bacterium]